MNLVLRILRFSLILLIGCQLRMQAQETLSPHFGERRARVLQSAGGGAVIIPGVLRTPYGQADRSTEMYFRYLTGWEYPGAMLLLEPGEEGRYTLFITPAGLSSGTYTGEDPGLAEAMNYYHADTSFTLAQGKILIPEVASRYDTLWCLQPSKLMYETINSMLPQDRKPVIMDARAIINDLRLVKDEEEITCLKRAAEVTAGALREAMMLISPGRWEYEAEAAIDHTFRSQGCDGPGFATIVGSGMNSTILHYEENNRQMQAGDLVVMDVGAQYKGYKADVTRTIPVSGSFSPSQRIIYDIVLEAQEEAIREMIPGGRTLGPHDRAAEVIMSRLFDLGLVTDTASVWQRDLYILYTATHHIGLDIHDLYPYQLTPQDESVFRPGMVITIEPGLYFSDTMLKAFIAKYKGTAMEKEVEAFTEAISPAYTRFKGMGIRIEDDIQITADGNIVISSSVPKEPRDIERLMKKKGRYK